LKNIKRYRNIVLFFLVLYSYNVSSQDLHYSQFYNSPLNLNPALTGIFNGDHRFTASVRDQWRFVPIPWFTFSGAYDFRIIPDSEKYFWGFGANVNYDRQGDSKLTLAALNLSGSYNRILSKNHILSLGIAVGLGNRGFDLRNLTWDKQWTQQGGYNPISSSGEDFDVQSVTFVETGAGINYRLQKTNRTKVDFGVGAFHLYQPVTTFYNTDNKRLPTNISFSTIGSIELTSVFDLQLHGLHQLQSAYRETVIGGLGKYYLNNTRGKETEIHFGLGYRTARSWIPTLAVAFQQWYVSLSYDIDNTEFNNIVNSNKGGPEIHFRYIITNVKPLSTVKLCPIY
jgi:type IX secretion system PorP/SprF family membrane protein